MSDNRITALAQRLLDVVTSSEGTAAEHFAAILLVSDAMRQAIARTKGLEHLQQVMVRARNMYRMFGVVFSRYNPDEEKLN